MRLFCKKCLLSKIKVWNQKERYLCSDLTDWRYFPVCSWLHNIYSKVRTFDKISPNARQTQKANFVASSFAWHKTTWGGNNKNYHVSRKADHTRKYEIAKRCNVCYNQVGSDKGCIWLQYSISISGSLQTSFMISKSLFWNSF